MTLGSRIADQGVGTRLALEISPPCIHDHPGQLCMDHVVVLRGSLGSSTP
jgi:hypothetical protein